MTVIGIKEAECGLIDLSIAIILAFSLFFNSNMQRTGHSRQTNIMEANISSSTLFMHEMYKMCIHLGYYIVNMYLIQNYIQI